MLRAAVGYQRTLCSTVYHSTDRDNLDDALFCLKIDHQLARPFATSAMSVFCSLFSGHKSDLDAVRFYKIE